MSGSLLQIIGAIILHHTLVGQNFCVGQTNDGTSYKSFITAEAQAEATYLQTVAPQTALTLSGSQVKEAFDKDTFIAQQSGYVQLGQKWLCPDGVSSNW